MRGVTGLPGRTIAPAELESVLQAYDAGRPTEEPRFGGGTANANADLQLETGRYFLKRRNPKYADPGFVAFDHALMEHLAPFEVGTPLAVRTREGRRWHTMDGSVYELFPFQEGEAHDRHSLEQIASAGRALARFHTATRRFEAPAGKAWPRYQDPERIGQGLEEMGDSLAGHLAPADLEYLWERVGALEREFPDERYRSLPSLVVHGDYHPGNVKYRGDKLTGIFDLDWATCQPRLLDLADGVFLFAGEREKDIDAGDIVSLTQTFRPSAERSRAFLDGYLETETVTHEEWDVLGLALQCRWLFCRVGGRVKLSPEDQAAFVASGLIEPLRALDSIPRWN